MQGVINIYKNKGMTSFDVVRKVKKIAKMKKVGHTGTLDPEACGVLPVCLGKATKIIDYIMVAPKVYEVTFKLGVTTTTYDLEGEVVKERDITSLTEEVILEAINKYKGEYLQVPPMYSALKQNGVRLYDLARQGIEVEREGRKVNIYSIENIKIDLPFVSMEVECSKGTYIRSLCFDIGEELNVGAVMTDLKRTKTSVFSQNESINIDELTEENIEDYIIPLDYALREYDKVVVDDKFKRLLINGVNVYDNRVTNSKVEENKLYRVYDKSDNFIGLGKKDNKGFKLEKLLV